MKKIILLLTAICMSILLVGCMNVEVNEKVSKDGNVTQSSKAIVDKKVYLDAIAGMTNTKITAQMEADIDKELTSQGYTLQTIDGVVYYVNDNVSPTVVSSLSEYAGKNQQAAYKGQEQYWETGMCTTLSSAGEQIEQETGNDPISKSFMDSSYILYSIEFDYDIVTVDPLAVIDGANPKKASWKLSFGQIDKGVTIYAYCKSDITVSGITQGASYKKGARLHYEGAAAAYNGQPVANDTYFNKHGQHTVILTAPTGEQRTVTFFVDKKKPVISKIKKNKTYKSKKTFKVSDKDSGIASVKINGKKAKLIGNNTYRLGKKGKNRIVIKDNVGNVTKMTVKVK